MTQTKSIFRKLLAFALVFMLALTVAVPALAERVSQDNLQVVIHNNEGLPGMDTNQFTVYQLFKGTPHEEEDKGNDEYGADNWNNYTLANVQWGSSVKDDGTALLDALQKVSEGWAQADDANIFEGITDAAGLAKLLESKIDDNTFLQHFSAFLSSKDAGLTKMDLGSGNPALTNGATDAEDYLTYTFTDPGYYLFADTHTLSTDAPDAVSEYILAVLGDQEINLKASVPTVDKEIVGGENGTKGDAAGIGDYVQFKLTGTLPKNFADFDDYKYIFHDTLSEGLDFVNGDTAHPLTVTVYPTEDDAKKNANGVVVPITYGEDNKNYEITTDGSEEEAPKCNLEVKFTDLKKLMTSDSEGIEITADSYVVVTYYAKVNEKAKIGSAGNPNAVKLEYSNDPNHEGTGKTIEKKVYVFAFGLDLTKIGSDAEHDADHGLPGAGFVMSKTVEGVTYYAQFENVMDADGETVIGRRLKGWVKQASPAIQPDEVDVKALIDAYTAAKEALDKATTATKEEAGSKLAAAKKALEAYLLESGTEGAIPDITGLDEGDYALEEVIVPDGYNTPAEDFKVNIEATLNAGSGALESVTYTPNGKTGEAKTYSESSEQVVFHSGLLPDSISNQKAPFLPFTGGMGTLVFYALGLALIGGAVAYLVIASKKRKTTEENA